MKPRPTILFGKDYHWIDNENGTASLERCYYYPEFAGCLGCGEVR